jgi:hypothetical protein
VLATSVGAARFGKAADGFIQVIKSLPGDGSILSTCARLKMLDYRFQHVRKIFLQIANIGIEREICAVHLKDAGSTIRGLVAPSLIQNLFDPFELREPDRH